MIRTMEDDDKRDIEKARSAQSAVSEAGYTRPRLIFAVHVEPPSSLS